MDLQETHQSTEEFVEMRVKIDREKQLHAKVATETNDAKDVVMNGNEGTCVPKPNTVDRIHEDINDDMKEISPRGVVNHEGPITTSHAATSPVIVSRDEGESDDFDDEKNNNSLCDVSGASIDVGTRTSEEVTHPNPNQNTKPNNDDEGNSNVHNFSNEEQLQLTSTDPWMMDWNEALDDPLPDTGRYSQLQTGRGRKKRKRNFDEDDMHFDAFFEKPRYAPHVLFKIPDQDPNDYYIEEESWRYHNPPLGGAVAPQHLKPLPNPPPLPDFPNTGLCKWSFDAETRVVLAKFRGSHINVKDEEFFLSMMERDDITIISEGLIKGLDKEKWTLASIENSMGDEFYHKFRRFDRRSVLNDSNSNYMLKEIDKMLSMKVGDYLRYLALRRKFLQHGQELPQTDKVEGGNISVYEQNFAFTDHEGKEHSLNVADTVLYMIDFDLVKLLPKLYKDFLGCIKLPGILPGGAHCMMNFLNRGGRPFMGPNLYVTPPGSFTHLHQDGHGTVDSGHFCISGFNEVVMLRRMPERHKQNAQAILNEGKSNFQALYNLPHGDHLGDKPHWPTVSGISRCKEMGYCPSVFILKPGQLVHINKGRLHAFRKLSRHRLPVTDCHAELRQSMLEGLNSTSEILCISVAWDWMFRGVSSGGINREVVSMLECAELNRRNMQQSLAIPELCLLQMARKLAPPLDNKSLGQAELIRENGVDEKDPRTHDGFVSANSKNVVPATSDILRGILPGLKYIVNQHIQTMKRAEDFENDRYARYDIQDRTKVERKPNAWENSNAFALDPYGAGDFFCKLCLKEMSNVYLHCDGCEKLLSKDFNICLQCHCERKYKVAIGMHPVEDEILSTAHHTGSFDRDKALCSRKIGTKCDICSFCTCCSCKCHTNFTLRFRFFTKEDEEQLLNRVKSAAGSEPLQYVNHVDDRLTLAATGGIEPKCGK